MEFILSPQLCATLPNFKIGVIQYTGIEVGPSPQMLRGRLQLFQESLYFELEEKNISDYEGIKEWRKIFKQIGKDPNRYRHSAEALFRRIKKQQYLQSVNSAADLNNFFSLQYEIPLGIYDVEKIVGNMTMRIGEEGEEYIGLNGRMNSLAHLIVTADDEGPFGSPFVDSERCSVTESTRNAVQIVYVRPSMEKEEAEKMVTSLMNMFTQIHGGKGDCKIVGG